MYFAEEMRSKGNFYIQTVDQKPTWNLDSHEHEQAILDHLADTYGLSQTDSMNDADKRLVGVYIDITGNKEIYKRPEMVHLLKDCKNGSVNLIFSQTRAYLAANTCDFCFLLQYLFDMPMRVDVVTDDDDQRIDTILNVDNQRQSLKELQRIMGIAALPMFRNTMKQSFRRKLHGLHIWWHPAGRSAVCRILW